MTETERELWGRIERALDRIRPAIESHGGEVDLEEIRDGVASVRMSGACIGCPMAPVTLQMGIMKVIRDAAPEIAYVVPAEDD